MNCVTGKKCYGTKPEAEEALIENHIRYGHRPGSGPLNVYDCQDCGCWHFTSTGSKSQVLEDPEVQSKIEKERKLRSWEDQF